MSQGADAKCIKSSKAYISMWIKRCEGFRNVDDLLRGGSARKTTDKKDKLLVDVLTVNPRLSLRQAPLKLNKKIIDTSCESIRIRLRCCGIKFSSVIK